MRLTDDLTSSKWIWAKRILFLLLAMLAGGGLLMLHPDWVVAALLALCVWAACRWYYFMFYVIEHYTDPGFRFAGLGSWLRYAFGKRTKP